MQKSDIRRQRPNDGRWTTEFQHAKSIIRQSAIRILHSKFFISSRGQAMTEYVIIAGLLMASLGILTVFFVTFQEYSGRILALVSSEYP